MAMAALAATAIGFSACSEDSVDEGMSVIKDSQPRRTHSTGGYTKTTCFPTTSN